MIRKIQGFRVGKTTPEKALQKAGLDNHTNAKELVDASAPFDGDTLGYLSQKELDKGAAALAQRYLPQSGTVRKDGFRYRASVAENVVAARGAALGQLKVKDVVAEAAKADDGNKYLNKAELSKAADKLAGLSDGPLAISPVEDFSVEKHVLGNKDHLGHEFFFGSVLGRIPKYWADRLIRGSQATERVAQLSERLKKEGAFELPGGVKVSSAESKPSKFSFGDKGPYVVLEHDGDQLYIEDKSHILDVTLFRDGKSQSGLTYMNNDWMKGLDTSFKHTGMMAIEMGFAMGGTPGVKAAAALGRIFNIGFDGGKGVAEINDAETQASEMRTVAIGAWSKEVKMVEQFQKAAAFVKKNGEQSLGDSDMTVSIQKQLKVGDPEKVLVKGQGPLLVFNNHASGVDYAVSLDKLKKGELQVFPSYMGAKEAAFSLTKDGTVKEMGALEQYGYTLGFDATFMIDQMLNPEDD